MNYHSVYPYPTGSSLINANPFDVFSVWLLNIGRDWAAGQDFLLLLLSTYNVSLLFVLKEAQAHPCPSGHMLLIPFLIRPNGILAAAAAAAASAVMSGGIQLKQCCVYEWKTLTGEYYFWKKTNSCFHTGRCLGQPSQTYPMITYRNSPSLVAGPFTPEEQHW